jgi:hypothetical protein
MGRGEGEKQEGKKKWTNFFPKLKRHKRHQPLRPIWPFTWAPKYIPPKSPASKKCDKD